MDRTRTCDAECCPPMRAVGSTPFDLVLPAARRSGGELGVDALNRRTVSQDTVLRQSKDSEVARRQSQTCTAFDAANGTRGRLSETAHDPTRCRTQDLPLFTAKCDHCSSRSGMEHRHHLSADATRILVSGRGDRLVQSLCVELATFQHAHDRFLSRGARRSTHRSTTGDLQQRPRLPVHGDDVYRATYYARCGNQYGRSWSSAGQRVCRAALEEREARGGVLEGLLGWMGSGGESHRVLSLLLPRTHSPGTRLSHAS